MEEHKICLFCGKTMRKRDKENPASFNRRKYCSRSCGASATKNNVFKPMEKHPNWNGGVCRQNGYTKVIVRTGKYRGEHTIIAEKMIGRALTVNEIVHHKNGIRSDNRIENLQVLTRGEHSKIHQTGRRFSDETKQLFRKIRYGTNQKENHQQWRNDVTKEAVVNAINNFKSFKLAAKHLNINVDTLRARRKYYNL